MKILEQSDPDDAYLHVQLEDGTRLRIHEWKGGLRIEGAGSAGLAIWPAADNVVVIVRRVDPRPPLDSNIDHEAR